MKHSLKLVALLAFTGMMSTACDEGAVDIFKSFKSKSCSVDTFVPACTQRGEGHVTCGADGKTVITPCPEKTVCRKDGGRNVSCIEKCKAICVGEKKIAKCNDKGEDIVVDCTGENEICSNGACVDKDAAQCTPGCKDNKAITCNGDTEVPEDCGAKNQVCKDNKCVDPGESGCAEKCEDKGMVCKDKKCVFAEKPCVNHCADAATAMECKNGTLTEHKCGDDEFCSGTTCVKQDTVEVEKCKITCDGTKAVNCYKTNDGKSIRTEVECATTNEVCGLEVIRLGTLVIKESAICGRKCDASQQGKGFCAENGESRMSCTEMTNGVHILIEEEQTFCNEKFDGYDTCKNVPDTGTPVSVACTTEQVCSVYSSVCEKKCNPQDFENVCTGNIATVCVSNVVSKDYVEMKRKCQDGNICVPGEASPCKEPCTTPGEYECRYEKGTENTYKLSVVVCKAFGEQKAWEAIEGPQSKVRFCGIAEAKSALFECPVPNFAADSDTATAKPNKIEDCNDKYCSVSADGVACLEADDTCTEEGTTCKEDNLHVKHCVTVGDKFTSYETACSADKEKCDAGACVLDCTKATAQGAMVPVCGGKDTYYAYCKTGETTAQTVDYKCTDDKVTPAFAECYFSQSELPKYQSSCSESGGTCSADKTVCQLPECGEITDLGECQEGNKVLKYCSNPRSGFAGLATINCGKFPNGKCGEVTPEYGKDCMYTCSENGVEATTVGKCDGNVLTKCLGKDLNALVFMTEDCAASGKTCQFDTDGESETYATFACK